MKRALKIVFALIVVVLFVHQIYLVQCDAFSVAMTLDKILMVGFSGALIGLCFSDLLNEDNAIL